MPRECQSAPDQAVPDRMLAGVSVLSLVTESGPTTGIRFVASRQKSSLKAGTQGSVID